jgi:hypothetical protein
MRHLLLAIALKLAALVGLWWFFIHDRRVDADPAHMATHLLQPSIAATAQAADAGASR